MVAELDNLVDANGKVKAGYEARASYILNELNEAYGTEYELVDGVIEGYDKLKDTIYDVIEAKKAEIVLEANQENYAQAIQHRAKLYTDLEEATKDANIAETKFAEFLKKHNFSLEEFEENPERVSRAISTMSISVIKDFKSLGKNYKKTKKDVEEASKAYEENNKTIIYWEDLKTATIEGDQEKISEAVKQITNTYKTEAGSQQLTLAQQLREEKAFYEQRLEELEKNDVAITEETKKTYASVYNTVVDSLIEQTNALEDMTPEIVEAWKQLATDNIDEYTRRLSELNPELQTSVQKATGIIVNELGYSKAPISNQICEIKSIMSELGEDFTLDPSVEIKPKVKLQVQELKDKLTTLKSAISGLSGSLFNNTFTNTAIDTALRKLEVAGYESGGFPVTGEMFVARENGIPEMIGKIGNRTSVANNMQIIEGIKAGVYEAVVSANAQNGGTSVRLDVRADEGIIVKKASKGFKEFVEQTGELPFPVPV